MTRALIESPSRGVPVVMLLSGAIGNNIVRQASRPKFGELLEGVSRSASIRRDFSTRR